MAKNNKRKTLNDAELWAYSGEHLDYEIEMLVTCAVLLEDFPAQSSPAQHWALRNATVESFAIHLRNILDFLYPTVVYPTDVLADDFFPDGVRPEDFPKLPAVLESARRKAHKQISHLTTGRLPQGNDGKSWLIGQLLGSLWPILQTFAIAADRAKLHNGLREFLSEGAQKRAQLPEGKRGAEP